MNQVAIEKIAGRFRYCFCYFVEMKKKGGVTSGSIIFGLFFELVRYS